MNKNMYALKISLLNAYKLDLISENGKRMANRQDLAEISFLFVCLCVVLLIQNNNKRQRNYCEIIL